MIDFFSLLINLIFNAKYRIYLNTAQKFQNWI